MWKIVSVIIVLGTGIVTGLSRVWTGGMEHCEEFVSLHESAKTLVPGLRDLFQNDPMAFDILKAGKIVRILNPLFEAGKKALTRKENWFVGSGPRAAVAELVKTRPDENPDAFFLRLQEFAVQKDMESLRCGFHKRSARQDLFRGELMDLQNAIARIKSEFRKDQDKYCSNERGILKFKKILDEFDQRCNLNRNVQKNCKHEAIRSIASQKDQLVSVQEINQKKIRQKWNTHWTDPRCDLP